jgi:hypothetical protein
VSGPAELLVALAEKRSNGSGTADALPIVKVLPSLAVAVQGRFRLKVSLVASKFQNESDTWNDWLPICTVIPGNGGTGAADAQEAAKSMSAPRTELSSARFSLFRVVVIGF